MKIILCSVVCASVFLLSGCFDVTKIEQTQAFFDSEVKNIIVDIDFYDIAGDISPEELSKILSSKKIKVSGVYAPTRLIEGKTAETSTNWAGGILAMPTGRTQSSIYKYIELNGYSIRVINGRTIRFMLPRKLDFKYNYLINGFRIEIPNLEKSINWELSPVLISFDLASTSRTPKVLPFFFESDYFSALGRITVSGAYPTLESRQKINWGYYMFGKPADFKEKVNTVATSNGIQYSLIPINKYALYKKALSHSTAGHSYKTPEFDDLKGLEYQLDNQEMIDGTKYMDSINFCSQKENRQYEGCIYELEQYEKSKVRYAILLEKYKNLIKNRANIPPQERASPSIATIFEGKKITENNMTFTKIDNHVLELIKVGWYDETATRKCSQVYAEHYNLFYIDAKLIDLEITQESGSCNSNTGNESKTLYFNRICDTCKSTYNFNKNDTDLLKPNVVKIYNSFSHELSVR